MTDPANRSSLGAANVEVSRALEEATRLHPVEDVIGGLLARRRGLGYRIVDPALLAVAADVERRLAPATARCYLRLLLARLTAGLEARLPGERLPASVVALLRLEAERILAELRSQPEDFYRFDNDLFLKDLGLCLLELLPCGAELVQVGAGIPRRILVAGGSRQLARASYFFLRRTRGFGPFYALHMDPRRLTDFSPEGWDRTYLRIADLLALNPDVKGVFGTAWFYDPRLEEVSPHLAYIRRTREERGAWNFRLGPTEEAQSGALERSASRRRLHAEGRYQPESYYLVWPRAALLDWAARTRGTIVMMDTYASVRPPRPAGPGRPRA